MGAYKHLNPKKEDARSKRAAMLKAVEAGVIDPPCMAISKAMRESERVEKEKERLYGNIDLDKVAFVWNINTVFNSLSEKIIAKIPQMKERGEIIEGILKAIKKAEEEVIEYATRK